jgi:hypothetical protein
MPLSLTYSTCWLRMSNIRHHRPGELCRFAAWGVRSGLG